MDMPEKPGIDIPEIGVEETPWVFYFASFFRPAEAERSSAKVLSLEQRKPNSAFAFSNFFFFTFFRLIYVLFFMFLGFFFAAFPLVLRLSFLLISLKLQFIRFFV